MKWLLIVVVAVVVLAVVIWLAGTIIPRGHQASSRITVAEPPAQVWSVVRDFAALPSFWADLRGVERLPDRGGVEAWKQTMKNGFDLVLLVTEDSAPRRMVTTIDAPPGAAFGGRWIYELEPVAGGTQVTITEDGWIDNRFFRVVSRATGYHGTLDRYLKALGAKLEAKGAPVHLQAGEIAQLRSR